MKSGKLFMVLLCVGACFILSQKAGAVPVLPVLDLWMTGELVGTELTVEVYRANTEFGLSGLSYDLQFSEPLELSREYSDYGWIASDGIFDISNPTDGSAPDLFTSIRFDTVRDPAGTEFPAGTDGIVEVLTCINVTPSPERWIYFDLIGPSASNGQGQDLVNDLGGSINIIPKPGLPEPHTYGVRTPEPTTLMLFGLGGLFLRKKRTT